MYRPHAIIIAAMTAAEVIRLGVAGIAINAPSTPAFNLGFPPFLASSSFYHIYQDMFFFEAPRYILGTYWEHVRDILGT